LPPPSAPTQYCKLNTGISQWKGSFLPLRHSTSKGLSDIITVQSFMGQCNTFLRVSTAGCIQDTDKKKCR
jgi:hypothetical protein